VIGLARKRGFEVIERRIIPDELTGFSECFITGSAAEVTAVAEIAHWNFNPGGITKTLMDDYTAEVKPKAVAACDSSYNCARLLRPQQRDVANAISRNELLYPFV